MDDGFASIHRYSISVVTQGKHRFYTLTVPSDVLAATCFVTTRDEDPQKGFQRVLDIRRAQEIADYIDKGLGTIPNSIVLSAQQEAELRVVGRGKTVEFRNVKKAFLVLDGQHRVYGFSLAHTALRVPVVIYNGLTRRQESQLFIDINTKQRPVPNELLLDIKSLAEYETNSEELLRHVYDLFNQDQTSPLLGLMSPAKRESGKLSRVTFNAAVGPLIPIFSGREADEIYSALAAYVIAFLAGLGSSKLSGTITNPIVFRAVMLLFKDAARSVQDRYGKDYTVQNFSDVLRPLFQKSLAQRLNRPGSSVKELHKELEQRLGAGFVL